MKFHFAPRSLPVRLAALVALSLACLHAAPQSVSPRIPFDIAEGTLAEVLLQIGRSSGLLISFNPALVRQSRAPAIRGFYTVFQAVALATRGTGLVAEVTASGTVTVSAAVVPAAEAPLAPPSSLAAAPDGAARQPGPAAEVAAALPRVEVLGTGRPQEDGLTPLRGSSATRTNALLADLPQTVSVLTAAALDI